MKEGENSYWILADVLMRIEVQGHTGFQGEEIFLIL
jgi:hypothetical protein